MFDNCLSAVTFRLYQASVAIADRPLLHPLSFTFPAGKVTAVMGHNGSGKSTLMKLLSRNLQASAGQIYLNNDPLADWKARAFARQVAWLPQQLSAADGMTVRELAATGRYPWHGALGRFRAEDKQWVDDALQRVGLTSLQGRLVDTLSGGERQRAWLAMLVAQHSRCLLLDEPTSALDIACQVQVLTLIRQLSHQQGLTVIMVLHDINMAARYCDHIIALRQGTMIANGAPSELISSQILEQIYGIPMGVLPHPVEGTPVSFVY